MPIINPFWFYLIDVLGNLKDISGSLVLILFAVLVVLFLSWLIDVEKDISKWLKYSLIVTFLCIGVNIVIPSEKTMYTMMVANVVTYENVEKATDAISESVDYILDKFGIENEDNSKDKNKDKEVLQDEN